MIFNGLKNNKSCLLLLMDLKYMDIKQRLLNKFAKIQSLQICNNRKVNV